MTTATAMSSRSLSVWVFVLFTGLVFGASGLVSKSLIDNGVDAFIVTGVPFAAGATAAWVVAISLGQVRREAIASGLLLGALNSAVPALFFNIGYETLTSGLVTLLLSIGPAVTAAIAHFVFLDERFNGKKGLGLVLAFAGVTALVLAPGVIEGASYSGAAWVVAGATTAGGAAVIARKLALRYGARALVAPQLTSASIIPLVAALLLGRRLVPLDGFSATHVLALVGIGLIASYGGFRSLLMANEIGTTGQVAMVGYLIPLIGVIGGIVFFSEQMTAWIALGGAMILAGVTIGGRASSLSRVVANTSSESP